MPDHARGGGSISGNNPLQMKLQNICTCCMARMGDALADANYLSQNNKMVKI